MKHFTVLSCLFALLLPSAGFAHGKGTRSFNKQNRHQEISKPAQAAVTKRVQLALTLKGKEVRLSVKDMHGAPIKMGMASATVFVVTKETNTWFKLYPNENEQLVGTGEFIPNKDLKFEVTLRLPGEKPINASFTPAISEKPTRIVQ